MKNRINIFVLISVFLCSFANLTAKDSTIQIDIQKELLDLSSKNTVLEDNIQILSSEKTTLQKKVSLLEIQQTQLQKQYTDLEEIAKFNIEQYHDDTTSTIGWMFIVMSLFFTFMMAILGAIIPYQLNKSNTKKLEKRMEDFKLLMIKDKEDAKISANKAKISELFSEANNERDPIKKIKKYDEIIIIDKNHYKAYNNRGNCKMLISEVEGALSDYNKAIEIDSSIAHPFVNRGILYGKRGNYSKAFLNFNRAIEIDNKLSNAYEGKACSFLRMDDLSNALKNINIALSIEVCFEYYVTRAEIYTAMKEFEKALADFDSAINLNDNDISIYESRAKCYRAMAEENVGERKNYKKLAEVDEQMVETLKQ